MIPRTVKMRRSQGPVPSQRSRKYPKKRPTIIEDGSMSPTELSSASFRKLGRGGLGVVIDSPGIGPGFP
jgi:hypothetical protein